MKKLCIILSAIIILGSSFFGTDYYRIKNEKPPIFAVKISTYKDGGSKEYLGLGYKIIKYNVMGKNGETVKDNYEIGSYFLKSE